MRLKRIELYDDFRSLKSGFSIDFIKEPVSDKSAIEPYCIVGRNGSGKSNILELLAAIFYQVEISRLDFLPRDMVIKYNEDDEEYEDEEELEVFLSNTTEPNAYKLEYFMTIDGEERLVTIDKKADEYREIYLDENSKEPLGKAELQNTDRNILPEYIIGYSSGQNEILSLPFYKMRLIQLDEYIEYLYANLEFHDHESKLIYLDDNFSQAIFLTNFIFADKDDHIVNSVFKKTIGVEYIESFRIVINHGVNTSINGDRKKIIEKVSHTVEALKNCATMYFEDDKELILDFFIDKKGEMRSAFIKNFGTKIKLFEAFQTFINLNYYHIDVATKHKLYNSKSLFAKGYLPQTSWNRMFFTFKDFMLKKTGIEDTVHSRSLSDGEYQFLHSIGLALIYRDTQSLFLLDEPETHFNPSWRAEYMRVLEKCFSGIKTKAEFLITSHSPFIVSDTHKEKVLIFEKEKGKVNFRKAPFNTFGASSNKITIEIFDKEETIGKVAQDKVDEFDKKIKNSKDLEKLMGDVEKELGDSMEKMLLLQKIIKQKEGKK